ncbi:unnamed protein product [Linum trigynum]|uniref:Uncharacterized protein n=1 Tax=Linum trigynum TaxID=586398 RepID=A0AAV2E2W1_9ROSI
MFRHNCQQEPKKQWKLKEGAGAEDECTGEETHVVRDECDAAIDQVVVGVEEAQGAAVVGNLGSDEEGNEVADPQGSKVIQSKEVEIPILLVEDGKAPSSIGSPPLSFAQIVRGSPPLGGSPSEIGHSTELGKPPYSGSLQAQLTQVVASNSMLVSKVMSS